MIFSVQLDDFRLLNEAVNSRCDCVRFGSEFCQYKMPSLEVLQSTYEIVINKGKAFTYITPRLSNSSIEELRKQLTFLNEKGNIGVVINDFGSLNIVGDYKNLHPIIGRQLTRVPARSPWTGMIEDSGMLKNRQFKKTFYSTSLNYPLTIEFFRSLGVGKVDCDWVSSANFDFLANHGLKLSVHLHLVPITLARRCHTARFVGEKNPEECSRSCFENAYLLKLPRKEVSPGFFLNEFLTMPELFLYGNVVFKFVQPLREDVKKLRKSKVDEFVLSMNPITRFDDKEKIDDFMLFFKNA